jgi:hypothetical protein
MIPPFLSEIGIGNKLLEKLCDIINKHIEYYGPTEQMTQSSIPVLENIIANTVMLLDDWDASADGKQLKILTRTVATYCSRHRGEIIAGVEEVANEDKEQEWTHSFDKIKLKHLQDFHKRTFVYKLQKSQQMLADQQLKLKGMRSKKVKAQRSIERRLFKVSKNWCGIEVVPWGGLERQG